MTDDIDKILEKLKQSLTGEREHDLEQIRRYAAGLGSSPKDIAILSALGYLAAQRFPDIEAASVSEQLGTAMQLFHEKLERAQELAKARKFVEAEQAYREFIADISIDDIEDQRRLSFNHPFEEMIFRAHDKDSRPIVRISNLPQVVFYQYGTILLELAKYDEAKAALINCQKLNPVDVRPLFELAEIAKLEQDFDEVERLMAIAHSRIFTRKDLAKYYRSQAFIANMRKQFRLAVAMVYISLDYDESPIARAQLNALAKIKGIKLSKPKVDESRKLVEGTKIQLGPSEAIVDLALHIGQTTKMVHPSISHMAYSIAYDMTHYKPLLNELSRPSRG